MKKLVSVCARTKEVRPTRRERTHNAMEGRRRSEGYGYDAKVRERQMGYDNNLYLGGGQVKGDTGECYLCLSQTADLGRNADVDKYQASQTHAARWSTMDQCCVAVLKRLNLSEALFKTCWPRD